jgi:two-component system response regulator
LLKRHLYFRVAALMPIPDSFYQVLFMQQADPKKSNRARILLVEDDPQDVLLTSRALCATGLNPEITVVNDGPAALDYLFGTEAYAGRDLAIMPTLILLDLHLPKMNGLEVLHCLKNDQRTSPIAVIMLTGSDYDLLSSQCLSAGAASCLTKPPTTEIMARILTNAQEQTESVAEGSLRFKATTDEE